MNESTGQSSFKPALLPGLAAIFLAACSLYFAVTTCRIFPNALPLPEAAAPISSDDRTDTRLTMHYDLLEHLGDGVTIEVPHLSSGSDEVARSYGHMRPLRQGSGRPESIRSLVVAVPLGAKPGNRDEVEHETRHALYLPTPGRITWRLKLPAAARMLLALAALPVPGASDSRLTVTVRALDSSLLPVITTDFVVQTPKSSPETGTQAAPWWTDKEIDLSSMSSRTVALELHAQSLHGEESSNVSGLCHLLIGAPEILGLPEKEQKNRPNLLWINIDTVQAAVTGVGGDDRHTTPELDTLASEGVAFQRVYSAGNWTRPANMAFFTGLHPSESGMKTDMIPVLFEEQRAYYLTGITALPLHLQRQGYRTRAVVQNNLLEDGWDTGVDVGFREYRYVRDTLEHSNKITEDAIRFMQNHRDESWFLYLGYNAPHWPYRPSRQHLARVGMARENPTDWLMSLYRGEVSLSDDHIAPLMETLHNLGLEQDTLVIVNSDHGEQLDPEHAREIIRASLWEEGRTTHERTFPGHETLFDETIHVPLVMRWPGHIPTGRTVDLPIGLVDIPPTILDQMGLPPLDDVRGRSVASAIHGKSVPQQPILIEGKSIRGVIDWPLKYIRRDSDNGKEWIRRLARDDTFRRVPEELYDLEQDPRERNNLADAQPEVLQRLRNLLASMSPEKRYLYFIEARGPENNSASSERLRILLTPGNAVTQLQLFSEEPGDVILPHEDAQEITLRLDPGDTDRLVLQTSFATTSVDVQIEQMGRKDGNRETGKTVTMPIRLGQWQLPAGRSQVRFSDSDTGVQLDSAIDPQPPSPGISIWRMMITGGIPGRSGKLSESMEATFRGWGYAK